MTEDAFTATIPRLTTDRLLIREFRLTDFDAFAENKADPEATKYLSAGPLDRREAWRSFISGLGGWVISGAGWWAVELRATGEFVGTVGAFFRETDLHRRADADLEIGWTTMRPYWGKGYAREAAARALAYGLERHPSPRAIALIDQANEASIAVSKAIGMRYDREIDFYGKPSNRYVIERQRATAVVPRG